MFIFLCVLFTLCAFDTRNGVGDDDANDDDASHTLGCPSVKCEMIGQHFSFGPVIIVWSNIDANLSIVVLNEFIK